MTDPRIEIDRSKCIDCGSCAKDCVSGVIHLVEGKSEVKHPEWCNLCSHCQTVCPSGAISHSGLRGEPPRLVAKDKLNADCYREIVMTRRSVRQFRPEPVADDDIRELIDLCRYSPTASNTMSVGYIVVTDRDRIRATGRDIFRMGEKIKKLAESWWGRIIIARVAALRGIARYTDRYDMFKEWFAAGRDTITHNAPALVLIHGIKGSRFSEIDCAIAGANFTNYAHARGLGTCYLGLVTTPLARSKKLQRRFEVPDGRSVYIALALGKPAVKYRNTPVRPEPDTRFVRGVEK